MALPPGRAGAERDSRGRRLPPCAQPQALARLGSSRPRGLRAPGRAGAGGVEAGVGWSPAPGRRRAGPALGAVSGAGRTRGLGPSKRVRSARVSGTAEEAETRAREDERGCPSRAASEAQEGRDLENSAGSASKGFGEPPPVCGDRGGSGFPWPSTPTAFVKRCRPGTFASRSREPRTSACDLGLCEAGLWDAGSGRAGPDPGAVRSCSTAAWARRDPALLLQVARERGAPRGWR